MRTQSEPVDQHRRGFPSPEAPGPLQQREVDFLAPNAGNEEEPEYSGPRRAIRLGVNFLWILGAILITVLQMCRGGA
jgi:hypothetical protein